MKIDFFLNKYQEGILLTDEQTVVDDFLLNHMPVIGLEIDDQRISAPYTISLSSDDSLEDVDIEYLEKAYCRQKGLPICILETKHCIVREFCMNDIDGLFEFYESLKGDTFVEPLFDYDKELEYEQNYIKYIYDFYGYGMWLVFSKDNPEKIIGRMGLETRETCEANEAELGYILHPKFRHKGLASEVCYEILNYGKNLGIKKFLCRIDQNNIASIKFAEKLGFKYDKNKGLYSL